MSASFDRRSFFLASASLPLGLSLGCDWGSDSGSTEGSGGGSGSGATGGESLFSISLAQWSLHREHRKGDLKAIDFPKASKELGFTAVEFVNSFYRSDVGREGFDKELKKACDDAEQKPLLIMCDGLGQLGNPDESKREQAVDNHKPWLELAKGLGCHSIRVNAASAGSYEEQLGRAADGLRALCEVASPYGLNVLVENHGGLSSNGAWLAAVMKRVDHPRIGTLPDFGNFRLGGRKEYDRYKGVQELMPYAKAVSAKSNEFDDKGNEVRTDYRRMLKIVRDAGYRGFVGVEYEGAKHSERDGIVLTRKLLETVRSELAG